MKSEDRYFRVKPRQIAFLKFILEAYEGLATLTTLDPAAGLVRLRIPPGCAQNVEVVLEALKTACPVTRVDPESARGRICQP